VSQATAAHPSRLPQLFLAMSLRAEGESFASLVG